MIHKISHKLLFLLLISLSFNLLSQENVKSGILDLRHNPNWPSKNIKLDGEWEFYWHKLLTPKDFEDSIISPEAYINIPGNWQKVKLNDTKLPDTGYATIKITILNTVDTVENISIFVPEIIAAYKIWLNDDLIIQEGKVGISSEQEKAIKNYALNSIELQPGANQIIIQYSNFINSNTNGVYESIKIGPTEKIVNNFLKSIALYIITFGIMLIMSLYHFGLFILRKKNLSALSFALLTLVFAIRNITTSTYFIQYIYPNLLSLELSYKISYWTFYLFVPTFVFFFNTTFEEKKHKIFNYIAYSVAALFIIITFFDSLIYTKLLFFYQIFTLIIALFLLYFLIKYVISKKVGSNILFISFLILLSFGIHDILIYHGAGDYIVLVPLGIIIFTFGQSLTLARIFTNAFALNEKLTIKLNIQNKHLQKLVEKRTEEIEKQKQDILLKNEELIVQKEELQTQKDSILKQKEIIEEHSQLINESIQYASSIQRAILPSTQNLNLFFENFIIFKPKDIVSGDFYWFSDNNPNFLFFAVGDCTGHGVPGSFLSLISSYLLNNIFNEKGITDPKEALEILEIKFNRFLNKQSSHNIDGMDISILKFDRNSNESFIFAGAKSSIIVLNSKTKELKRYKGARKGIGNLSNKETKHKISFINTKIPIEKDTIIYIYTDGYIDQNNTERKRFGTQRLKDKLIEISDDNFPQQKISLLRTLDEWQQNSTQRDDITIVALRVNL